MKRFCELVILDVYPFALLRSVLLLEFGFAEEQVINLLRGDSGTDATSGMTSRHFVTIAETPPLHTLSLAELAANQTVSASMKFSWTQSDMANLKLVVTAEDPTFDEATLQKWREEGFNVSYLTFDNSREQYAHTIEHLSDPLALGENYAIVGPLTLAPRFWVHQCPS